MILLSGPASWPRAYPTFSWCSKNSLAKGIGFRKVNVMAKSPEKFINFFDQFWIFKQSFFFRIISALTTQKNMSVLQEIKVRTIDRADSNSVQERSIIRGLNEGQSWETEDPSTRKLNLATRKLIGAGRYGDAILRMLWEKQLDEMMLFKIPDSWHVSSSKPSNQTSSVNITS